MVVKRICINVPAKHDWESILHTPDFRCIKCVVEISGSEQVEQRRKTKRESAAGANWHENSQNRKRLKNTYWMKINFVLSVFATALSTSHFHRREDGLLCKPIALPSAHPETSKLRTKYCWCLSKRQGYHPECNGVRSPFLSDPPY